jgi:hypothetical protein
MSLAGSRQLRLLLVAPAVIGLALATAACGGTPQAGVASLATTTTARPAAAASNGGSSAGGELGEYAECMRSHGALDFPADASFESPDGVKAAKGQMVQVTKSEASTPTFQAGQRACAQYLAPPTTSPQVSATEIRELLAVAHCMRAHGVSAFPDPNPTTGAMNPPAGIDRTSPQVFAALRACSSLGKAAGLGPPNNGQ